LFIGLICESTEGVLSAGGMVASFFYVYNYSIRQGVESAIHPFPKLLAIKKIFCGHPH